jgi:hypothetical protein
MLIMCKILNQWLNYGTNKQAYSFTKFFLIICARYKLSNYRITLLIILHEIFNPAKPYFSRILLPKIISYLLPKRGANENHSFHLDTKGAKPARVFKL